MADETTIEPDGARRLLNVVESVGGDLQAALDRVRTVRSTLPEPWGTDEYGRRFAKPREPKAENILGNVLQSVTYLRELAAEGKGAIDEFVNTDHDNSSTLAPGS
ncbi:hypothetical protein AB0M54_39910 [Actinoplanes sp. NPDC051470]|uniref:hypothetical protein n=1 Tax=unclassified Actinoplanes TaxID=2626549 RepID=UPI00342D2858